jgi:transposase, IS5 family
MNKEFALMRMMVQMKPCFLFNISPGQQVVKEYEEKYNEVDRQLLGCPGILKAFHNDVRHFGTSGGRESKYSSEQILRVLIIKALENLSFRDLVIRLEHDDFLRNFARIGMDTVMTFTFINAAFKCVSAQTWERINTVLSSHAIATKRITGEKLRVDSTVMETNIHYPTDSHLLWDVYRVLSREMRRLIGNNRHWGIDFRFHDRKAKKLFVFAATHYSKKNLSTVRKVAKTMKLLVERTEALVEKAEHLVGKASLMPCLTLQDQSLCQAIKDRLPMAKQITTQSRRAQIQGETVPASDRIFSFFESHTELLKRGKAQKPIEFGHLVTLAQTGEKFIINYAVEETSRHDTAYKDEVIKHHHDLFKKHPEVFTADKNYYVSMEDIEQWTEKIPVYAIGKKGNRSVKEYDREHTPEFKDAQRFRAGCEGSISVLKRAFGLRRCLNRSFRSFASSIGCMVFVHNLVLLSQK